MRAILLGLAVTLGVPAANQAETAPNLAGVWTISVNDGPECEFGGQAVLKPTEDGYTADLTMHHDCPFFPEGGYTAVQTSEVSLLGNQVSVRSKIVEFANGNWSNQYAPDHFALTIQSDGRLFGIQTDRYGTKPAEWQRREAGIS